MESLAENESYYELKQLVVHSDSMQGNATATIKIEVDGQVITEAATGNGPVDAAYNAIARASECEIEITSYKLSAKGEGQDALGQVDIDACYQGQSFHGMGLATDVVEASAQALVHVMNLTWRADKVADCKQKIGNKPNSLGGV